MTEFTIRFSYTDRKFGPGTGRTLVTQASSLPVAMGRAARIFWNSLDGKQRNDVRRDGLKTEIRQPYASDSTGQG